MLDILQAKVLDQLKDLPALDMMTWVQIAQAVIEVIKACRRKNPGVKIYDVLQNPGLSHYVAVRRQLHLRAGSKIYKSHGDQLLQAIFAVGKAAPAHEIDLLCQQVA